MVNNNVFTGGTEQNQVFVWLSLWMSVIGSISSLLTIILILKMKSNTGHVYLVFVMSCYQLLYDVSFFFSNVSFGYYMLVVANFLQIFGGIAGAFTSNWIAFVATYIVWYRKKISVFDNITIVHVTCLGTATAVSLVYFFAMIPTENYNLRYTMIVDVYNNLRALSIFLNFVFVLVIGTRIFRNRGEAKTPQEIAIRTLAYRMVYYPLVQAVGRSGFSWYEFAYGPKSGDGNVSQEQYGVLIFATVITPTVSVGYLIIFLVMQPNAYRQLLALLPCAQSSADNSNEEENAGDRGGEQSFSQSFSSVQSSATAKGDNSVVDYTVQEDQNYLSHQHNNNHSQQPCDSESRYSMVDWVRKNYRGSGRGSVALVDMREEDELYAILEHNHNHMSRQGQYSQQERDSQMRNSDIYRSSTTSVQYHNTQRESVVRPIARDSSKSSNRASQKTASEGLFTTENVIHQQHQIAPSANANDAL